MHIYLSIVKLSQKIFPIHFLCKQLLFFILFFSVCLTIDFSFLLGSIWAYFIALSYHSVLSLFSARLPLGFLKEAGETNSRTLERWLHNERQHIYIHHIHTHTHLRAKLNASVFRILQKFPSGFLEGNKNSKAISLSFNGRIIKKSNAEEIYALHSFMVPWHRQQFSEKWLLSRESSSQNPSGSTSRARIR